MPSVDCGVLDTDEDVEDPEAVETSKVVEGLATVVACDDCSTVDVSCVSVAVEGCCLVADENVIVVVSVDCTGVVGTLSVKLVEISFSVEVSDV